MHNIVHIQIKVTDLATAMDFYHKVFNWKVFISPDADYLAIFEIEDNTEFVGGGFLLSDEIPTTTSILLYIHTDDIETTLEKVEANGGKIVSKKYALPGNHGYAGKFSDPFGNVLGLFRESDNFEG